MVWEKLHKKSEWEIVQQALTIVKIDLILMII